jgi:diguanylate cyclase (GGDEF)-like protein
MSALDLCAAAIGGGVAVVALTRLRVYGAALVAAAACCTVVWAICAYLGTTLGDRLRHHWLVGDLWVASLAATVACLVVLGRRLDEPRWRPPRWLVALFAVDTVAIFALLNPRVALHLFGHYNPDGTFTYSAGWAVQGLYVVALVFVLATDLLRRTARSTGRLRVWLIGALGAICGAIAFQAAQIQAASFFGALCTLFLCGAVIGERAAERVPTDLDAVLPTRRDPVTRVLDRAALAAELTQAGSAGELALIVIDVDNLKPVNDTYGHAAGDAYLRTIATRIVAAVGSAERVGRYGGDEFVIVLPHTGLDEAAALGAAIVVAVHQPHHASHATLMPSVSVGVAARERGAAVESALAAADAAMYVAKRAGGDRVSIAGCDPVS